MSEHGKRSLENVVVTLDGVGARWFVWTAAAGTAGLLASAGLALTLDHGVERVLRSYLVSFVFFLSLALGALFFVLIQHLTRAGWSVLVRRIAESYSASVFWPLAVLVVPILAGMGALYPWSRAEELAGDPVLRAKAAYLNVPFFVVRAVIYFGVWTLLARFFFRHSVAQDDSGDPAETVRMERRAGVGVLLFAVTVTFFAVDFLMSLAPHWSSTIYGVYYFAGSIVGFFALLPVSIWILQRAGRLRDIISMEHYHDMGKLVFAFVVFWTYIAFSQYMLMWYANLPEETVYYAARQTGAWTAVSLILLGGHFVIPFAALLSRFPKRRPGMFVPVALWVLLMHWLDCFWLVMPTAHGGGFGFHASDIAAFVGIGGWFLAATIRRMRGRALVPVRDPRVRESLGFENV